MPAKPYMNIFIGDWMQDTRLLNLEEKGAFIELKFACWQSVIVGVITLDITESEKLLGVCYSSVRLLLERLKDKNLITLEDLGRDRIRITDIDMQSKSLKSATKAAAGKKGMQSRYKKEYPAPPPVTDSVITKTITNAGIGIGNNNGTDKEEKGGAGGKEEFASEDPDTPKPKRASYHGIYHNSQLALDDCLDVYLFAPICEQARELLCNNFHFKLWEPGELRRLKDWAEAFNRARRKAIVVMMQPDGWSDFFYNWIAKRIYTGIDPKTICSDVKHTTSNGTTTGTYDAGAANAKPPAGNGSIEEIMSLKRGGAAGSDERTEDAEIEVLN